MIGFLEAVSFTCTEVYFYFKYFINLKTLELGGLPRFPTDYAPGDNLILIAVYRPV